MKEILNEWKKFLKEQQEEQEKQTTGQELTLSDEVYAQLVLIIMAGAYKLVFENHFTNKNINFMHKVEAVWPYQQIEQAKQENENIREMFKNIFSYLPKNKRKYLLKDSIDCFITSPL